MIRGGGQSMNKGCDDLLADAHGRVRLTPVALIQLRLSGHERRG